MEIAQCKIVCNLLEWCGQGAMLLPENDGTREKAMRADDIRTLEVFVPRGEGGFPVFAGSRMMILGTRSVGRMQEDLERILGPEQAATLLARHGYEAGMATAMAMGDLYEWDTDEECLRAGVLLRTMAGLAHERVSRLEIEPERGALRIEGTWRDSLEASQWLRKRGRSEEPVCHILAGWASGYASACLGGEVWVRETSCRAQGHPHCRFEGRPVGDWDEAPETMRPFRVRESMEDTMERMRGQLRQAWAEVAAHRAQIQRLRERWQTSDGEEGFVYRSDAMAQVRALAERVAPTNATVLISGESGTGKEVVVRFIHRSSERSGEPFLAVDCAALPENLLESELFGHVKGAFTGADRDKRGLFVEAGGGTLFLDEVGELPVTLQAKLLRALQERSVRPVGGTRSEPVGARIVAATNRDLQAMVQEGGFRQDLYYRLAVIPIRLPPLRERRDDILPLARCFLERFRPSHPGFSPEAVRKMTAYRWPGNVRELENAVEHACVLAGEDRILAEHLPPAVSQGTTGPLESLTADLPSEAELIRRYTRHVLAHTRGNRSQAAGILDIHVSTLWRRLRASPEIARAEFAPAARRGP